MPDEPRLMGFNGGLIWPHRWALRSASDYCLCISCAPLHPCLRYIWRNLQFKLIRMKDLTPPLSTHSMILSRMTWKCNSNPLASPSKYVVHKKSSSQFKPFSAYILTAMPTSGEIYTKKEYNSKTSKKGVTRPHKRPTTLVWYQLKAPVDINTKCWLSALVGVFPHRYWEMSISSLLVCQIHRNRIFTVAQRQVTETPNVQIKNDQGKDVHAC